MTEVEGCVSRFVESCAEVEAAFDSVLARCEPASSLGLREEISQLKREIGEKDRLIHSHVQNMVRLAARAMHRRIATTFLRGAVCMPTDLLQSRWRKTLAALQRQALDSLADPS
eukprot:SAG31_NODE_95_length_25901_cov_24.763700_2_plen_114_part_00